MKRPKYGNRRTEIDGHSFASQAEARRYGELELLVQAGTIWSLILQPRYPLKVNGQLIATYVADFCYLEERKLVVEDVKGYRTPEYTLKAKLFQALYPLATFREIQA